MPGGSGQLMTMPVLIVNMGGEMVYILEQRLQAQKIPEAKGQKVLNDVVRTMYYPRFIDELFKPQEMYSLQSTRQIFDRLAHSSIMRLNESSMDKLFDLMAMGFKYQIMSCTSPKEMIDVTHNHLEALKRLVSNTPQLLELVEECVRQMGVAYGDMPLSELSRMRQCLCTFFQDRKVKVSLFLHDHTQNHDGSIVVGSSGVLGVNANPPGTVRYFQGGQQARVQSLGVVCANNWKTNNGVRTTLGANLYEKDRPQGEDTSNAPAPESATAAAPAAAPADQKDSAKTAAAVGELNMLASLIGAQAAPANETFKLESLFGSNVFSKDAGKASSGAEVIQIDGTAPSDHHKGLESIRQQMDGIDAPQAAAGQDDLLDLMDKA